MTAGIYSETAIFLRSVTCLRTVPLAWTIGVRPLVATTNGREDGTSQRSRLWPVSFALSCARRTIQGMFKMILTRRPAGRFEFLANERSVYLMGAAPFHE